MRFGKPFSFCELLRFQTMGFAKFDGLTNHKDSFPAHFTHMNVNRIMFVAVDEERETLSTEDDRPKREMQRARK